MSYHGAVVRVEYRGIDSCQEHSGHTEYNIKFLLLEEYLTPRLNGLQHCLPTQSYIGFISIKV